MEGLLTEIDQSVRTIDPAEPRMAPGRALIASERLAAASLFLPLLLTGYWALHILGVPRLWPLLVMVVAGWLIWDWRKSRPLTLTNIKWGAGDWKLTLVLLLLIVAPPVLHSGALAKSLALTPLATDFVTADDAYDLLIERGLERGYPPIDLSYAGTIVEYHYGLPMLAEFIHRSTGIPPHAALYGVLPGLFSLLTLISVFRVLVLLFPEWSINRLLLAVLLAQGCLLLDGYNVLWHLRDLVERGSLTLLGGMPMAATYSPPVLPGVYASASAGVVLLLVLFANMERCHPLTAGLSLFAIYLTKQQLFLPLAIAWAVVAVVAFARKRELRTVVGLGIGTSIVIASKIITPFETGFALKAVFNDYFLRFGRGPSSLTPMLLDIPVAALLVVGLSALLGTHIYGPAMYLAYVRNRIRLSASTRRILIFIGVYFLSAIAIMIVTVLVMNPAVAARFDAVNDTIGDHLWLPKDTYRLNMMNVSLAVVLAPCGVLFSMLATGAILQWHKTTASRTLRVALSVFCAVIIGVVAHSWTQAAAWHPPASWHVVADSAVEALKAANDNPGIILTNDLRFRPGDHLPLMNAWAPQLLGQQFYTSNFMYFSFTHPDAIDRLHEQTAFWSTPVGDHHRSFLADNDIKYLLIRRDMPFPQELPATPWLRIACQNDDYYLLQISHESVLP